MKRGSRFSAKAAMASCVSWVEKFRAWHRASSSTACSMEALAEAWRSVLVIDDASGGPLGRAAAQIVHKGIELLERERPVHQADGRGLFGAPHVTEQRDLFRAGHPDQPWQQPRRAVVEREAALGEDHGQLGPLAADDEVAPERQGQPRTGGKPSTLAIVGFVMSCSASATSPSRRIRARPDSVGCWGAARVGEVGPGTERAAGAGQDHHPVILVVLDLREDVA